MKTGNNKSAFDYKTIRNFADACKKAGKSYFLNRLIIFLIRLFLPREFGKAIAAVYRLMIVYKAVNDGWTPDWSNSDQYKYYPWFRVLPSGFGFSSSSYSYDYTATNAGSRLYTDASEKALYIAAQFEQEYKDLLLLG